MFSISPYVFSFCVLSEKTLRGNNLWQYLTSDFFSEVIAMNNMAFKLMFLVGVLKLDITFIGLVKCYEIQFEFTTLSTFFLPASVPAQVSPLSFTKMKIIDILPLTCLWVLLKELTWLLPRSKWSEWSELPLSLMM